MELSFLDLKEREIINVYDGKKLGRIIDIVFNNETGLVRGIIVPGDKKMFRKVDDIFIPIEKVKRIGNDVILIGIQREENFLQTKAKRVVDKNIKTYENYYNRYYPQSYPVPPYSSSQSYPQTSRGYYEPRQDNSKRRNQNIVTDKENSNNYVTNSKLEVKNSPHPADSNISYVRLRPLDRKKYK